jgi:hypothetical protein
MTKDRQVDADRTLRSLRTAKQDIFTLSMNSRSLGEEL